MESTARVVAVLAVKRLDDAKTRLAASLGRGRDPGHRALVLAMMRDTLDAVISAGIDRVVVVSPDDAVLEAADCAGALGLREQPDRITTGDTAVSARLNLAFAHASRTARNRWPDTDTVVLIQADLPAASPASVREVLGVAAGHLADGRRHALLTDRDGSGTTMLVRDAALDGPPLFGPGSAGAHRAAGAVEIDPDRTRWPDLRTDVDTADDLAAAIRVGLGKHTSNALARPDAQPAAGRPNSSGPATMRHD